MSSAILSKVALCVCPPALLATTVTAVPPVRKAVHHITAPHARPHHRPHRHVAPRQQTAAAAPCALLPPVAPLITFASLGPEDTTEPLGKETPDGESGGPSGAPLGGASYPPPLSPGGFNSVSPVPEPATWLMLIAGFGMAGSALRVQRRRRYAVQQDAAGAVLVPVRFKRRNGLMAFGGMMAAGMGAAWTSLSPLRASPPAAAVQGVGVKAIKTAALAKAAMCICPPAAMIAATAALPPVRHAVYSATAPRAISALPVTNAALPPCPPEEAPAVLQMTPSVPLQTLPSATAPLPDTPEAKRESPTTPASATPPAQRKSVNSTATA